MPVAHVATWEQVKVDPVITGTGKVVEPASKEPLEHVFLEDEGQARRETSKEKGVKPETLRPISPSGSPTRSEADDASTVTVVLEVVVGFQAVIPV